MFVAAKLVQTGMFIYCFDKVLDNKTLYLLRYMTCFRISIAFDGGESIKYLA